MFSTIADVITSNPYDDEFFIKNEYEFLYSLKYDFGSDGRQALGITGGNSFVGDVKIEDVPNYKEVMIAWYVMNQKLHGLNGRVNDLRMAMRNLGIFN